MDWSGYSLLGDKHPFASMGVRVDEKLRPLSSYDGTLLHENVRIAGRTLGGYDCVTEKSGTGAAIVRANLAGRE